MAILNSYVKLPEGNQIIKAEVSVIIDHTNFIGDYDIC